MKKILLAVIMVLMFASPVMAGTPTIINGVGMNLETVNVDNRLYLPLRTISELLGFDVQWDGTFVRVNSAKMRPVITGDDNFKDMINQALDLLKTNDPPDYETICKSTKEIVIRTVNIDTEYGEAYALAVVPGNIEISPKIFTRSIAYIAGTLVHESAHLCNYNNGFADRKLNENIGYLREIATLRILGASQQDIDDTERTRLIGIK
jgi:hypothetical protein